MVTQRPMDRSGYYHRGHHNRRSQARQHRPDPCPAVRDYTSSSRFTRSLSISCPGRSSRGGDIPAFYHGAVTRTPECRRGFYQPGPSIHRMPYRSRHADGSPHWHTGVSGRHLGSHNSSRYRHQSCPSSRPSTCSHSGPSGSISSGTSRGPMGGVPRTSAPCSAAHAGH